MSRPLALASAGANAQAAQAGLVLVLTGEVEAAFAQLDPANLRTSLSTLTLTIAGLVRRYGQASVALAAQFYREQRRQAGITSPFTIRPSDPASLDQVDAEVRWATRKLWGPLNDEPVTLGTTTYAPISDRLASAQTDLAGSAEKMTLVPSRQTIIDTVRHDDRAIGWARVTEPDPCYFCALLATRGAVYKADTVNFQAHDHERCHAEPVFNAYEPSAQVREWQALYKTIPHSGGSKGVQAAWRHAYDAAYPATTTD